MLGTSLICFGIDLCLVSFSVEAPFNDTFPLNVGINLIPLCNYCMRHNLMSVNFFIAVQELVGVFPQQVLWKE